MSFLPGKRHFWFSMMLHPDGDVRTMWDMVVAFLVVISVWIIPFTVAFQEEAEAADLHVFSVVERCIDVMFMMHVLVNFRTAIHGQNGLIIATRAVAYILYACLSDLIIHWFLCICSPGASAWYEHSFHPLHASCAVSMDQVPLCGSRMVRSGRTRELSFRRGCVFRQFWNPSKWKFQACAPLAAGTIDPCCIVCPDAHVIKRHALGQACILSTHPRTLDRLRVVLH